MSEQETLSPQEYAAEMADREERRLRADRNELIAMTAVAGLMVGGLVLGGVLIYKHATRGQELQAEATRMYRANEALQLQTPRGSLTWNGPSPITFQGEYSGPTADAKLAA